MPVSPSQFREVFGSYPAQVAIITAVGADGQPRGFTCTTTCAVSATPPLLLICVDDNSQTLPAILTSRSFVVNILAAPGEQASRLFAGKAQDKFDHLEWRPSDSAGGAPILTDIVLAYAECRVVQSMTAGDHRIVVGQVEGSAVFPREPLLYGKGDYHAWPSTLGAALGPVGGV
ncbi:flavin reductase family protein [Streptomyces sp. NPDC020898]|uniref:flavin reductase family protein n=1 Tax=Streptomyces sp. NPDC020898 TaxID=3365101 RepID=UPI0037AA4AFA